MTAILSITVLAAASYFTSSHSKTEHLKTESPQTVQKKENPKQNEYLSITYTSSDDSVKTGRMMHFYTYDLFSKKLEQKMQIPFDSQYALGVVSLSDNKIYYSAAKENESEDPGRSVDHLYEVDLSNKKSTLLETENCAYNDIIPIDGKLLVTTVPVHAIGTALFDLNTRTFSYLYEPSLTEDGYMDFLYTTRPLKLNYNFNYKTFVNVSVLEKNLYSLGVRTGKKPLKFHISLVDSALHVKNEYIFKLPSLLYDDVGAVAQISTDSAILMLKHTPPDNEEEEEYVFYKINFSKQSCKKIKSPFPDMLYIDSFVTIDNGKSYYISGYANRKTSGLFYYDCSNNDIKPILLDDYEKGDHVVNFCLVEN